MPRRYGLRSRSFDADGREAQPVALLQHLVGGHGLAVDADQVVLRLAVRDPFGEERLDRGACGDFDESAKPPPSLLKYKTFAT